MEFDIYDKVTGEFMSTQRRMTFLEQIPFVVSVKVLHAGPIDSLHALKAMIGPSHFIGPDHLQRLRCLCQHKGLDPVRVFQETDGSATMEGLYIKVEEAGIVRERYKYVRAGFLQAVFDSQSHWLDRPIIPNQLKPGVSLF